MRNVSEENCCLNIVLVIVQTEKDKKQAPMQLLARLAKNSKLLTHLVVF